MPITPFHLIAIAPLKAIAPRKFSLSVFALTNIVIDLEPITLFLITLNPQHLFFHTIIGATLIAILAATFGKRLCELAVGIWNEEANGSKRDSWSVEDLRISKTAAWSGALIGAYSHLLLDSFMHDDIKPLSPFTDKNILLGTVDLSYLHTACIISALVGLLLFWLLKPKSRTKYDVWR
ncbi:Protein of unknown function DUF4184 [Methylophilaceae bacterium]